VQGKRDSSKGHMGISNLKLVGTKNRRGKSQESDITDRGGVRINLVVLKYW